ncbi:MAG: serine/threonine protein kinase [Planctomycetes bacterium]|nr:serine/threonine protein kinase [Planctomycetota bacterium]
MSQDERDEPDTSSDSSSDSSNGSGEELRERLDRALDAGGDPLRVLAELLAAERREEASVALLDLSGQTIDGFRLKRLLGHGGMGATYLAQAPDESWVAFKVMTAERESSRRRFESEAQALGTLQHPHIAGYLAHGVREDGLGWLAMERIEGPSLEALLQELEGQHPASPIAQALAAGCTAPILEQDAWRRRFLRLLIGVAEALQHAHERNLVHRDVKPQNILLRPDLSAVLVDFGIARDTLRPVSLTRTGARVGTPGYMAPEQFLGRVGEIGARTDVFALGLVLWRGLFGRDLFASEEELKRYATRARALLPASAQELGPQLRGVLYRALEPQVRHRYPSAGLFSDDLRSLLSDRPVTSRAPGALVRFGRTMLGRRLFLLSFGAGLFGTGYFLARERQPPESSRQLVLLTIDALIRGGQGWIDAREDLALSVCAGAQEVESGKHEIHYYYPDRILPDEDDARRVGCVPWKLTKAVDAYAARRHHRVTILAIASGLQSPNAPRNVSVGECWDPKRERCLLRLGVGLAAAEIEVAENGTPWRKRVPPGYYWVNPGSFDIEAFGKNNEHEEISGVKCEAWQRTEVVLLHRFCLPRHPDRFQITWGTIFAPKPSGLHLEYGDGWVEWLNEEQEVRAPGAEFHIHAALVPAVKDEFLSVELSISAPSGRRFRSGVLSLRLHTRRLNVAREDESIEFELDGNLIPGLLNREDMLVVLLEDANAEDPINVATRNELKKEFKGVFLTLALPAEGIEKLLLRYRVRTRREPQDFGSVEFAGGYLGPLSGEHHALPSNTGLAFRAELVPRV